MALRRPRLPWIPAFAGITRREAAMTRAGVAGSPQWPAGRVALAGDKPQRYTSLFRPSAVAARAMVVGVVGRAGRRVTLRLGT